jgi:hypothetical protein
LGKPQADSPLLRIARGASATAKAGLLPVRRTETIFSKSPTYFVRYSYLHSRGAARYCL